MSENESILESLNKLNTVFTDPRPSEIVDDCFPESQDILKSIGDITLTSIGDASRLIENDTALIFLSDEGYVFYLPIYIMAAINGAEELIDIIVHSICDRGINGFSEPQMSVLCFCLCQLEMIFPYEKEEIEKAISKIEEVMSSERF